MSEAKYILDQIQETRAALAVINNSRFEKEDEYGAQLSRRSFEKRLDNLQKQLDKETAQSSVSILDYRIFSQANSGAPVKMAAIGKALDNFQSLFSVVFDAIKNGPRQRTSSDAEISSASAFIFECSYQGSAGLVFTIPDEAANHMFGDDWSRAFQCILEITSSISSSQISEFSRTLGASSIRKIHAWAEGHALFDIGADIFWQNSKHSSERIEMSSDRFFALKKIIDETSDEVNEILDVHGDLVGADIKLSTFHLLLPDKTEYRGPVSDAVAKSQLSELSTSRRAKIRKTTTTFLATSKETVVYTLIELS